MQINSKNYPLVSVIINCFNGETYLADTIKSVLLQTYKNFEVIFWDNQSNDNSAYIYKSFKDRRLKYFYAKTHTSLYQARNLAIKKSKGKYIAFIDTDDIWDKYKLNLQIKKLRSKKISLVYSNYYKLNQYTGIKKLAYKKNLSEGIIYKELLEDYFLGIGTIILKKKIFFKNKKNFFDPNFNIIGDFDFFINLSKNHIFACIQKPLLTYRIHKESFSNKNYNMHINELKQWIKKKKFDHHLFLFIKQKIIYMQIIFNILNKRYFLALKMILKINSNKKKIKLFFFLLIPNFIFKKLKDNFS